MDAPVTPRGKGGYVGPDIPNLTEAQGEASGLASDAEVPGLRRAEALVDPGEFRVPFGRKYRGKKVSEIPRDEIEGYLAWLEDDAKKKRTPLSFEARLLRKAVDLYYGGDEPAAAAENG